MDLRTWLAFLALSLCCLTGCRKTASEVPVPGETLQNMQEVEAEVYYVAEYQEYCVKPMRKLAVFLESGQPLGAGREYRLPRGMKICMVGKEEVFTLA